MFEHRKNIGLCFNEKNPRKPAKSIYESDIETKPVKELIGEGPKQQLLIQGPGFSIGCCRNMKDKK